MWGCMQDRPVPRVGVGRNNSGCSETCCGTITYVGMLVDCVRLVGLPKYKHYLCARADFLLEQSNPQWGSAWLCRLSIGRTMKTLVEPWRCRPNAGRGREQGICCGV